VPAIPEERTELVRGLAVIGLVAVAYHYSLLTLLRSLNLETPLAYLGLVPFMALGLAAARRRPAGETPIHDRTLDWIVGVPLLAIALSINLVLPRRLGTQFWVWRMDLLSLPIFVAGAVALVLGTRALWRLRVALAFLFLAWPLPYTVFLTKYLDQFTETTLWGIRRVIAVWEVAKAAPSADGSLFTLGHGKASFPVSVASACSGVNGVVGFALVALAFMALVKGPRLRKAVWLVLGLSLIWSINVVRITLIFWAGTRFGERVAIDGLHPYIGLVGFNLGVIAMVFLLRPFGLELDPAIFVRGGAAAANAARRAVPKAGRSLGVLAAVGLVLAVTNAGLGDYDAVAGTLGQPRLVGFTQRPTSPDGWVQRRTNQYTWARRFFGEDSTWNRYLLSSIGTSQSLKATGSIVADVISTSDRARFSAYGVQACYQFHGYKLKGAVDVDLGNGVRGSALSYLNPKQKATWTAVYWHWPVKVGNETRYERVTLVLSGNARTAVAVAGTPAPTPGASLSRSLTREAAGGGAVANLEDPRLDENRDFLVAFAHELIEKEATLGRAGSPTATTSTTLRPGAARPATGPVFTATTRPRALPTTTTTANKAAGP
jgi:exosortase/archaeosortase family protein